MNKTQSPPFSETNLISLQETILIVDDSRDNLHLLSRILSDQGYKVRATLNGELALTVAQATQPDLILLDILMPDMNGFEVCSELKKDERTKDIPVIFISALHEAIDKVKAFALGGVDYITKPIQIAEVLVRVGNQLHINRLSKKLLEQNARLSQELEERKRTETELRISEERLQLALEASEIGLWDWHLSTGYVYYNPQWKMMLGYEVEEIDNTLKSWEQLVHPDDLPNVWEKIQPYLEGHSENYEIEFRMRSKSGEWKWIVSRAKVIERDASGKALRVIGTHKDISESKQAELELQAAKATLERQLQRILLQEKIAYEIRSSLDPEEFFQRAATQIGQAFNVDRCLVHLYVQDPIPRMPLVAQYRRPGIEPPWSLEIPVTGNAHAERILSQDCAIACDDVEREPLLADALPMCHELGLTSMLGVRTSYQGKPNGVIGVHQYHQQRHWTDDEISLLEAVAAQLGIAIAQANFLDHERQQRIKLDRQNQQLQQEIQVRQRTEEALKKSEERWQLVLKGNNEGIWDLNLITNQVFRSARYKEIMGYEEHELGDDNDDWVSRIHPDDFERVMQTNNDYFARKIPHYALEYRLLCKDGSYKWVMGRAQAVWDETGKPVRMVGSTTDISNRKEAEAALIESEKKYRILVETSQDAIWSLDVEGHYTFVNAAVKHIYGYEPDEMIGRPFTDFIAPEHIAKGIAIFQHLLEGTSIFQYEISHLTKDGKPIQLMFNAIAQRDSQGNVEGITGTASDITQRKIAEEKLKASEAQYRAKTQELEFTLEQLKRTQAQLIQAEKMSSLGQMIAGIAHEINNPVSFIYGNIAPATGYVQDLLDLIELYQQHYPKPVAEILEQIETKELDFIAEDFPKLLTSMKEGANRIAQIVMSLRTFSRLDERECKQVDIHQGIDNTLTLLQHRLKAVGDADEIRVIKNYGQLPLITCYASQLNQVFMNLLSNAIDALKQESGVRSQASAVSVSGSGELAEPRTESGVIPTITIHTEVSNQQKILNSGSCLLNSPFVIIRIADNGCGMSEEIKQKIFDPFFTTKPVGSGTGLGLSISYQIVVEKHQGQLSCRSVPGEGTEFAIALPIVPSCPHHPTANQPHLLPISIGDTTGL
jgi:PAS domain S-box-containing protein